MQAVIYRGCFIEDVQEMSDQASCRNDGLNFLADATLSSSVFRRRCKRQRPGHVLHLSRKRDKALHAVGANGVLESTTYRRPTVRSRCSRIAINKIFCWHFARTRRSGSPQYQTQYRVVGGVSKDSTDVAALPYGQIVDQVHPVSSHVLEACKLWKTPGAINIGMAVRCTPVQQQH